MEVTWKQPDGAGGYEVVHHETTAEMVKYSDTTVANLLSETNVVNISDFMSSLLTAANAGEIRRAIKADKTPFYDETGKYWKAYGTPDFFEDATIGNCLYCRENGIYTADKVTFGGSSFTLEVKGGANDTPAYSVFFHAQPEKYDTTYAGSILFICDNAKLNVYISDTTGTAILSQVFSAVNPVLAWHHYELDYDHAARTAYVFADGELIHTQTGITIESAGRYLGLGLDLAKFTYNAFGGWLNYFRLSNICRHSADFTPPAGKPVADEYTLSLLNFER